MTNKYHRQGYRIGGILKLGKKLFAKTAPERKDQLLESIKKKRSKKLKKRGIETKDVNVIDVEGKKKTMKDESKIMDVDTYTDISKASDKDVKKKLKAFGFKDK
jgi:predicted RND superfamily exporter protein